jgi:hypothetical protein
MRERERLHHSALTLNNNVQFAREKAAGMSSCWFKGDEAKLNFGLARQPDEKCCDATSHPVSNVQWNLAQDRQQQKGRERKP